MAGAMRLVLGAFLNTRTHFITIELGSEIESGQKVAQLTKIELQQDFVCSGGHELLRRRVR